MSTLPGFFLQRPDYLKRMDTIAYNLGHRRAPDGAYERDMTDAEEIAELEAEEAAREAICSSCGEDEPVWFEGKDRLCAACKEARDFESEAA